MYELRNREAGPIDYDVRLDLVNREEMLFKSIYHMSLSTIAHFHTNPYGHPSRCHAVGAPLERKFRRHIRRWPGVAAHLASLRSNLVRYGRLLGGRHRA